MLGRIFTDPWSRLPILGALPGLAGAALFGMMVGGLDFAYLMGEVWAGCLVVAFIFAPYLWPSEEGDWG